jgi:multisubunit Na+/H+ antiporter MnhG subunit
MVKKTIGWSLVIVGVVAFILDRLLFSGARMEAVGFAVLLAPVIGLYLLVDAYLKIEDGNVLTSIWPPRFWR